MAVRVTDDLLPAPVLAALQGLNHEPNREMRSFWCAVEDAASRRLRPAECLIDEVAQFIYKHAVPPSFDPQCQCRGVEW